MATEQLNAASIPSIQELLLSLAEYVTANITPSAIDTQQAILQAIQQTLINTIHIIDAYQLSILAQQEYTSLVEITGALNNVSVTDQILIDNRLAAFNSFSNLVYPLNTSLPVTITNLNNGQAAVQAYDLLNYFAQFVSETPPAGLNLSNFSTDTQLMATAWLDMLNYLTLSGTQLQKVAFNATDRMYNCSQDIVNFLSNLTFAANSTNFTQLWNSLVALPSILRVLGLLYNDPSSQQSQSINAIKFVIYNLIFETNQVLASFSIPNNIPQPIISVLRSGETLLDFAARTTGDYTKWTLVASANGLMPPYVGTVPAPGIATPGQKLYVPPFSTTSPLGNYTDDYLGTDVDIGPPGTELALWSGDFALIRGINNYLGALVRRVLTPVGAMIYHPTYGSRIPGEVGSIQTANEAALLSSYLRNGLVQDPRTQIVNRITAYPVNFGQIVLTALVTPYGSNAIVPLNLVIIPQSVGKTAGTTK